MTLKELQDRLRKIRREHGGDPEAIHAKMDEALLDYINDDTVRRLFDADPKWCA